MLLSHRRWTCHLSVKTLHLVISAEPSVTLVEITSSDHDPMLVCSAYDFYPKYIKVTWHRNGQEVTLGVTVSEVMTNGDWTYQVHSYLELTAGQQDGISCMVEHTSLREPKIYDWGEDGGTMLFMTD